jgi:Ribbon-helix-helix domain
MGDESVRWTVMVDRDLDIDLRTYLAQQGMKKGDLSKYIKEAVRWQMLRDVVADARKGFVDMPSDEIDALIDEALLAVRANPEAYDRDL